MSNQGLCLVFTLTIALTGCSPTRSNKTQPVEMKTVVASDGTIHLKPHQVETNGIEVAEVVEGNVVPVLVAVARVRTRSGGEAQVFSPFPGKLVGTSQIPRLGDFLNKGQHIADVEQQFMASERVQFSATTVQLQANIEQAQEEVELKRTELNRAKQLYDGGAIPQKQLQTAEFDLKQAESKLGGARGSKERYDAAQSSANTAPRLAPILAPISGTVIAADATLGQQVEPSKSLLAIADLSTVWVEAAVHERDLPRIRGAREAQIYIPGSAEPPFPGKLVTIGNLVDTQNRTGSVIFAVKNPETKLKINMYIEAHIPVGPTAKALLIPSSALLFEQGANSVYIETQPGGFQRKEVQAGTA